MVPDDAEIFDDKAMRKFNRDALKKECNAKGMIIKAGKCRCSDLQIKLENGSCQRCRLFERAQGGNTYCGPDKCNAEQTLTHDGTCEYCPVSGGPAW